MTTFRDCSRSQAPVLSIAFPRGPSLPKADNSGSNLHLSSHRWSWFFFVGIIPTFLAMLTLHHAVRLHAADLKTHGDRMFAGYFKQETAKLKEHCLADTRSIEDWRAKKEVYRAQLFEMLSLSPLPPRTPARLGTTPWKHASWPSARSEIVIAKRQEQEELSKKSLCSPCSCRILY